MYLDPFLSKEHGVPRQNLDGGLNDGVHLGQLAAHLRVVGAVLVPGMVHAQEVRHQHVPLLGLAHLSVKEPRQGKV